MAGTVFLAAIQAASQRRPRRGPLAATYNQICRFHARTAPHPVNKMVGPAAAPAAAARQLAVLQPQKQPRFPFSIPFTRKQSMPGSSSPLHLHHLCSKYVAKLQQYVDASLNTISQVCSIKLSDCKACLCSWSTDYVLAIGLKDASKRLPQRRRLPSKCYIKVPQPR